MQLSGKAFVYYILYCRFDPQHHKHKHTLAHTHTKHKPTSYPSLLSGLPNSSLSGCTEKPILQILPS